MTFGPVPDGSTRSTGVVFSDDAGCGGVCTGVAMFSVGVGVAVAVGVGVSEDEKRLNTRVRWNASAWRPGERIGEYEVHIAGNLQF